MADRTAFAMPSLGADMVAGTVLAWHVQPGDRVQPGDLVALVDTDKSEIEIETFDAGIVSELVVPEGMQVPVGTVIAYFDPVGTGSPRDDRSAVPDAEAEPTRPAILPDRADQADQADQADPAGPADPAGEPARVPHHEPRVVSPLVRRLAEEAHLDPERLEGTGPGKQVRRADIEARGATRGATRVSPRARRLARLAGLDPTAVVGTGPAGTVTGVDVLAHNRPGPGQAPVGTTTPTPATTQPAEPGVARAPGGTGRRDGTADDRSRRATAILMERSWREIPHYHLATRLDVSTMVRWLADTNETRPIGERILAAAVLLRATALAAARHPRLNGWWIDGAFRPANQVDLGTVVARRGGGLLAPTITDAASRDLGEVMHTLHDLVQRVRRGRLRGGDLTPASITVTNLGELGVDEVHGVIHPPQVALVGFGAVHEEAWADGGMVAARPVLHVSLAGDHRVSDGLAGAAFLTDLAELLEHPEQL